MRPRFSCLQRFSALANGGRLSHSTRNRHVAVHDCDVDVHVGEKCVFLTSIALVTSLLAISFYVIFLSTLLDVGRKKNLSKPNETSTALSFNMWKWFQEGERLFRAHSHFDIMKGGTQGFPRHEVSDKQEVLFEDVSPSTAFSIRQRKKPSRRLYFWKR